MAMDVKTLDVSRQRCRQILRQDAKTGTRGTRIVKLRLNLAVFRVDTQTHRCPTLRHRCKTIILAQRIKCDMAGAVENLLKLLLRISRRIRMRLASKLLLRQSSLKQRRSRRVADVLTKNRETLPQRKRLESQDDFYVSTLCHAANQLQVPSQQLLLHHITRRRNLVNILFK